MPTHVALIRGINVGRAKRVPMADLRQMVAGLGYTDVQTLLNSGNVVFTVPPKSRGNPAAQIEAGIESKLGVFARVLTITAGDLGRVVAENPFEGIADNPSRFLVTFVKEPADLAKLAPLSKQDWLPDMLALGTHAAYLWCATGILESKLGAAANRLLGERATTRNWATVLKLHALLDA